jgi:hypothetical protein
MQIVTEFSGGLELLFGGLKKIEVDVPEGSSIKDLLRYLTRNYIKERPELFIQGDTMYFFIV